MLVEEDEGEKGLQQSRLSDAPEEEVEVRRGGYHLLQGKLHREEEGGRLSGHNVELFLSIFVQGLMQQLRTKAKKAKMIVASNGTKFHYFRHSARLTRLHKKQIEESKTEMSGELFITMS